MVGGFLLLSTQFLNAQEGEKPFYLTLEPPPAPELTAQEALQTFHLAAGYDVALVAAEPLVEDPVAITWDESGLMYVVEMRGFMPDSYGNNDQAPVGMVVRLTDADDDGKIDTREVLLDKLILPRALAIVNEGLLVGEPPNLWLCPNNGGTSADIDCSAKQLLGPYGDQPGSVEHAENGLMTGLDNWLYNAKSKRRMRLRKDELIVEPTLFRGQWGITQDNDGRLFYNTNSNLLLGDTYDAQAVVAAGNVRAPGLGARVSTQDEVFAVRVNPGVNRAYVPGVLRKDGRLYRPTSASGMAAYRGDQLGEVHAQDIFVTEPAANALVRLKLAYDGLEIRAEHITYPHGVWGQVEFLASTDERFRPVDVQVGPDGALYVVDMYRGIIQDHVFITDQLRAQALARQLEAPLGMGRIWRISATHGEPLRARVDLASASTHELVELLGHANAWQRETAQRLLLVRADPRSSGKLDRQLKSAVRHGSELKSVHALWTLSGRDALDRRTVLRALSRGDRSISLAAVRAGHSYLRRTDLLKWLDRSADPVVAQQLTLSLGAHNQHSDVRASLLESLVAHAQEAKRASAIKTAAFQQELPLIKAMLSQGIWSASQEQATGFVQSLVTQGFRALAAKNIGAEQFLDFVQSLTGQQRWLQIAVLDGLYDASREDAFTRVQLVTQHSLFNSDDKKLWPAIGRARRAVTWPGDDLAVNAKPLSPDQEANRALGLNFFRSRCAACHAEDGKGIASLAPPLVESPWVTGSSERLARIILDGLQGPIEVAGMTWNGVMPGHAAQEALTDVVGSGLMTYLNRAWGHTGRAIDADFFAEVREQTNNRRALWTVPELQQVETNTHYRRYVGRYGRPGFGFEFVYNGQDLEVKSAIFNGPMVEEKEDQFLYKPRMLRLEFVLADNGQVTGVRMLSADGGVVMPRLDN
ncbi:MAG: glucose/arabinose dehydrogenase/mono/diheme cytochrome c family protein [Candidatus Azotimanducaceae bacterium]|jgi:glucose/arabinose dehydrogenase/mono/diheme cytochrome c family protein